MRWIGGIALAVWVSACSVQGDERCDNGALPCPTGFYCGGEWCYRDGTGPGPILEPDMADAPDEGLDMTRDGGVDMMIDVDMTPRPDVGPLSDMAPPDMAPDLAPPDMAPPDMTPDMAPGPANVMLNGVAPGSRTISRFSGLEEFLQLDLSLQGDVEGMRVARIGVHVAGDPIEPGDCQDIVQNVVFQEGSSTLRVTADAIVDAAGIELPEWSGTLCIDIEGADPQAPLLVEFNIDEAPPEVEFERFISDPSRESGVAVFRILSDDVDVDQLLNEQGDPFYRDAECINSISVEIAQPDEAQPVITGRLNLDLPEQPISLLVVDRVWNSTCAPGVVRQNQAPRLSPQFVACTLGRRETIAFEVIDEGEVDIALLEDDDSCDAGEPVIDGNRVTIDVTCAVECELHFELTDDLASEMTEVQILGVPALDRFETPRALGHQPYGAPPATGTAGGGRVLHPTADGVVEQVYVYGGGDVAGWREGATGPVGAPRYDFGGRLVQGEFTDAPGLEVFLANMRWDADQMRHASLGCAVSVVAADALTLAGPPLAESACAMAGAGDGMGDFARVLAVGQVNADAWSDVAAIDQRGRVHLWLGSADGPLAAELVIDDDRGAASDVALLDSGWVAASFTGRAGVVLAGPGDLGVIDVLPDLDVDCVEAVDWDADGVDELAICTGDEVLMVEVADRLLALDEMELVLTLGEPVSDVVFPVTAVERAGALVLGASGRITQLFADGTAHLDLPNRVRRLEHYPIDSAGYHVLAVSVDQRPPLWLKSTAYPAFETQDLILDMPAALSTGRPEFAADVDGDGRSEVILAPVLGDDGGILDWLDGGWRFVRFTEGERPVRGHAEVAVGDLNLDGVPDPVVVELAEGQAAVRYAVTGLPARRADVLLPDVVDGGPAVLTWGLSTGRLGPDNLDYVAVGVDERVQIRELRAEATMVGPWAALDEFEIDLSELGPTHMAIGEAALGSRVLWVFRDDEVGVTWRAYTVDGEQIGQEQLIADMTVERIHRVPQAGRMRVWLEATGGDTRTLFEMHVDAAPREVWSGAANALAIGDVDGDLRVDLLIFPPRGRDRAVLQTLRQAPNGAFEPIPSEDIRIPDDAQLDGAFIGDFDGDGRPDRLSIERVGGGRQVRLSGYR